MQIEIDKIKPYTKNAKKHPKSQIDALMRIVKEVGWRQPVLVNQNGDIVVGHGRFETWKQYKDILKPIWIIDDKGKTIHGEPESTPLTPEQEKAYRLADNKLNESDWEMSMVIDELKELDLKGFDITLTGFDLDKMGLPVGWNPSATYDDSVGDGINEKVGYGLQSFWKDIKNENSELYSHWLDLPVQETQNLVRQKYSRTNLEEIRRVVKTYMREGDYFLENCCGWSTFACSAVLQGFNGVGCDIWDTAIEHGKNQYNTIKGIEGVGKYEVIKADGMALPFEKETFDFVYCNPPFMDEEKYSGLENDIATKDFNKFSTNFTKLQEENYRVLKDDGLCVITINDRREKGFLIPIQKYVIEWSEKAGFKLWDFVIAEVESQKIRLRKKDYKLRRTVKCHEYVIVFKKLAH